MQPVFPLHYAGCVRYWQHLLPSESIVFEQHGFFLKQSYHNRCYIAGPNGKQVLTIPTTGGNFQRPLKEIEINYSENWQRIHWHAIQSAYGSSPFFEHYDYLLKPFYIRKIRLLIDFNLQLTEWFMKQLRYKQPFTLSESCMEVGPEHDFRTRFHAKKETDEKCPRYPQVFESKHGFIPNLSIFDLLFNIGPQAGAYLVRKEGSV